MQLQSDYKQKKNSILSADISIYNLNLLPIHTIKTFTIKANIDDNYQSYNIKRAILEKIQNKFYTQAEFSSFKDFICDIATECLQEGLVTKKLTTKYQYKINKGYNITQQSTGFICGRSGISPVFGVSNYYRPTTVETQSYDEFVDENYSDIECKVENLYRFILRVLMQDILEKIKMH